VSESGEPLRVAQAQLGHADLQTTPGIYTHLLLESNAGRREDCNDAAPPRST
jgi:integrase